MRRLPRSRTLRNRKQPRKGSHRDPKLKTEIEIRFIADGKDRTRVELEHRHLDRFGARRDEMRRIFDQEGDWGKLLAMFARAAEGSSS